MVYFPPSAMITLSVQQNAPTPMIGPSAANDGEKLDLGL